MATTLSNGQQGCWFVIVAATSITFAVAASAVVIANLLHEVLNH